MKFSLITVVYNGADTIEKTIKSVIVQNYPGIEYLVIDGGSQDETVDIIRKYESDITRWISEPDDGLYFAMNKGLEMASGDYVYFLNSGDTLVRGVIDRIAQYLELYPVDVFYGNIVHKKYGQRYPLPLNAIHWQIPMSHQSVFIKRNDGERFDTGYRLAADYKMIYERYIAGNSFLYLPIDIAFYEGDGLSDNLVNSCRERASVACEMLTRGTRQDEMNLYKKFILDFYLEKNFEVVMAGLDDNGILDDFAGYCAANFNDTVVFGTGDMAQRCSKFIIKLGGHIKYFVDNDKNKWGKEFLGYEILSPESLLKEDNKCVLIMNERYCENIRLQLNGMNLDSSISIYDFTYVKDSFKNKYKSILMSKGMKEVKGFEVIADT